MEIKYADGIEEKDFTTSLLDWQKRGLMYTKTGYGQKIPSHYTVKHNNRTKRVYCSICSNIGSLYIMEKGKRLYIR